MRDAPTALENYGTSETDVIPAQHIRRVRHITSIQIRNLTPFPARDALASALKQPAQQPQFTPQGHLTDDLDVALGRKRGRRFSSSSSVHLVGTRTEADGPCRDGVERTSEGVVRKRTLSKASVSAASSNTGVPVPPGIARRSSGGVPTVRPHRQRTISAASVFTSDNSRASSSDWRNPHSSSSKLPELLQDTSQRSLEKILQSRLVETFITVTLPTTQLRDDTGTPAENTVTSRPSTPDLGSAHKRSSSASPTAIGSSLRNSTARRVSAVGAAAKNLSATNGSLSKMHTTASAAKPNQSSHRIRTTSASLSNGKTPSSPTSPKTSSAPSTHRQRRSIPSTLSPLPSPSKPGFPVTPPATPPLPTPPDTVRDEKPVVPDYISPIHWPSTNPTFQIDARSRGEFSPGANLSGSKVRIEVWGKAKRGLGWASTRGGDPKGKGRAMDHGDEDSSEWRVLESWDLDLMDLVPLTDDLAAHPSHLHSNALVITLSPPGQTYYLPPPTPLPDPSPLAVDASGYNSEPESDVRKVKSAGEVIIPCQLPEAESSTHAALPRDAEDYTDHASFKRKGKRVTSSWPDLLQLIHLQACIEDTRRSLSSIVHDINELVTQPDPTLRREVSEREAWVAQLQAEEDALRSESGHLRERIRTRRDDIRKRKETLAAARESHESYSQLEFDLEQEIIDERHRLDSLTREINPLRSDVISTLAFIFPIELLSPPDLLFTILDVPLPIPVGATDPAPPLSLPSHKDVTEDTVATALGYAAQVVHLLAAYMGEHLVYPVTNIGSRSLIRDSISAMVGPRSFPLFTKGVETYRFEYGVYLLNKDIELLMSERNLRALDMRHTLPNLKNLLLTLTGSEGGPRPGQRFSVASSSGSLASLRSPMLTASSLPSAPPTSSVTAPSEQNVAGLPDGLPTVAVTSPSVADNDSPPRSGSTTPTRSAADAATPRKSRAFLDLTPLAGFGFFRGRYASSSRSASSSQGEPSSERAHSEEATADGGVPSTAEPAAGDTRDEEDDQRTIRGRRDTIVADPEGKMIGNGVAGRGQEDAGEKAVNGHGMQHSDASVLVHGTS